MNGNLQLQLLSAQVLCHRRLKHSAWDELLFFVQVSVAGYFCVCQPLHKSPMWSRHRSIDDSFRVGKDLRRTVHRPGQVFLQMQQTIGQTHTCRTTL